MLIQFNFKNYKSFREEASLDMSATKISEHQAHVIDAANDKLLKVGAIYGANAAGKSNVYDAFEYMTYYVLNSFKFGGENDTKQKSEEAYTKVTPFLFNKTSKNEPSTFEVFFIDNNDTGCKSYQYGFSISSEEVLEEWLFSKAKTAKEYKTVFYRKKGEPIDYFGIKKGSENIDISLEKETLIVSLGAKLKIAKLKMVRDWFMKNEVVNFGDPVENFLRSRALPYNFVDDNNVQKNVIKYFASFDEAIQDFKVEKEVGGPDNRDDINVKIEALHKMSDSDELASLNFFDESSGTLKMFALYPSIQDALENGSILFVDELNSRLHPLLVRNIILTFVNPEINKNNAQLIFTTHDIWQLSNDLLRRDEIWFVEKGADGASDLYSLADFVDEEGSKIRKDEVYAKNYLAGKYGAIPKLKSLDMMRGE